MPTYDQWFFAQDLRNAIQAHADALVKASEASDRNARSLTFATWVLAAATLALVIATLVLVFKG